MLSHRDALGAHSPKRQTEVGWVGVWGELEGGGAGLHVKTGM